MLNILKEQRKMYQCNNCEKTFQEPFIQIDDENDEQYDLCPYCFFDDVEESE